jgi:hypothetical protein
MKHYWVCRTCDLKIKLERPNNSVVMLATDALKAHSIKAPTCTRPDIMAASKLITDFLNMPYKQQKEGLIRSIRSLGKPLTGASWRKLVFEFDPDLCRRFYNDPEFKTDAEALILNLQRLEWWHRISEARDICWTLMHEIAKTGGERQRSEGHRLLLRIRFRLSERLTQCWEDTA